MCPAASLLWVGDTRALVDEINAADDWALVCEEVERLHLAPAAVRALDAAALLGSLAPESVTEQLRSASATDDHTTGAAVLGVGVAYCSRCSRTSCSVRQASIRRLTPAIEGVLEHAEAMLFASFSGSSHVGGVNPTLEHDLAEHLHAQSVIDRPCVPIDARADAGAAEGSNGVKGLPSDQHRRGELSGHHYLGDPNAANDLVPHVWADELSDVAEDGVELWFASKGGKLVREL